LWMCFSPSEVEMEREEGFERRMLFAFGVFGEVACESFAFGSRDGLKKGGFGRCRWFKNE